MNLASLVQQNLFDLIKKVEGQNNNWVDELCHLIHIKRSTAYKKIKGDIPLSLDEFFTLCDHYQVDYNFLTRPDGTEVTFNVPFLEKRKVTRKMYILELLGDLRFTKELTDPLFWLSSFEIPLVYEYVFPEIPAFKDYMSNISNWNWEIDQVERFVMKERLPSPELMKAMEEALDIYLDIKTIEIWNPFQLSLTLRQIWYCLKSGLFEDPEESLLILEALEKYVEYIGEMASKGHKFHPKEGGRLRAEIHWYFNEIAHTNNIAFIESQELTLTYITIDTPNYVSSRDAKMNAYVKNWFEKLIRHSTPLTRTSHRNRLEFIQSMQSKTKDARKRFEGFISSPQF